MKKRLYFVFYCFSFSILSIVSLSVGSIIPYISLSTHEPETRYSYLYACKSIGFLIGSLLCPYFSKYCQNMHQQLLIAQVLCAVFYMMMYTSFSFLSLGVFLGLTGVFAAQMNIYMNSLVKYTFHQQNPDFWLQVLDGSFAIGGIGASLIVLLYQEYSIVILGILNIICAVGYLFLQPTQFHKQQSLKKIQVKISKQVVNYLSIIFTLVVGIQMAGGLAPTYLLTTKVADVKVATLCYTCFYSSHLFGKFILIFITTKVSQRLSYYIFYLALSSFISFLLASIGFKLFASFVGGGFIAIFVSSLFPLLWTLPTQFNKTLNIENSSTIFTFISVSQILYNPIIGYSMGIIHPLMFFICLLILSLGVYYFFHKVIEIFEKQKKIVSIELLIPLQNN